MVLVPVGVKVMASSLEVSHASNPESGITGHGPLKVDLLTSSVWMDCASVLVSLPQAAAYNVKGIRTAVMPIFFALFIRSTSSGGTRLSRAFAKACQGESVRGRNDCVGAHVPPGGSVDAGHAEPG